MNLFYNKSCAVLSPKKESPSYFCDFSILLDVGTKYEDGMMMKFSKLTSSDKH